MRNLIQFLETLELLNSKKNFDKDDSISLSFDLKGQSTKKNFVNLMQKVIAQDETPHDNNKLNENDEKPEDNTSFSKPEEYDEYLNLMLMKEGRETVKHKPIKKNSDDAVSYSSSSLIANPQVLKQSNKPNLKKKVIDLTKFSKVYND